MTLDDLLLRCVSYTPEKWAVATPDNRYTYRDLAHAVDNCANALLDIGLMPGDRVLGLLDPGLDAVALFCACARLRMIAVPVSRENSSSCIQMIMDAALPAAFISDERDEPGTGGYRIAARTACGSLVEGDLRWEKQHVPERAALPRSFTLGIDPSHVSFRFDDDGLLKGVVMSHRAACCVFETLIIFNALPIGTVIGSIAPVQSDFWLLNAALALGSGGTVAFVPRHSLLNACEMARQMRTLGIEQMNGLPSIWKPLLERAESELRELSSLSSVLFAREPFPASSLEQLQRFYPKLRVIHCFGHTESIACSFAEAPNPVPERVKALSFGRGCEGMELLLLNENGVRVQEPDVPGELYVRSPALFMGYWNDPVATAKVLVPHPLLPETGERVFRTGDLACFDEEGNYFFVGRADDSRKATSRQMGSGSITISSASGLHP